MVNDKLTMRIQSLRAVDINIALFIVISLAGLNAIWVIWESVDTLSLMHKMSSYSVCTFGMSLPYRNLRIETFLIIAAIALWRRNAKGIFISTLFLTWVCAEYWWWHLYSQRILENAGIPNFSPDIHHAFNLFRATEWDVIVLLVSGVLLVWEIKTMVIGLVLSRRADEI